jgi:hypothetical protein
MWRSQTNAPWGQYVHTTPHAGHSLLEQREEFELTVRRRTSFAVIVNFLYHIIIVALSFRPDDGKTAMPGSLPLIQMNLASNAAARAERLIVTRLTVLDSITHT